MFVSFRHPPPTEPGYRFTAESAQSIVGLPITLTAGETRAEGTVDAAELIDDTGELWLTVEVPDGTPWLDAIRP